MNQTVHSTGQEIAVDAEADGQRIDNFLARILKGVPRSHLYRILRRGEVRVNKGRIKAAYRVRAGDRVRIPPLRLDEPTAPARVPATRLAALESAILFEDARLLVIDKPAGLAVHGGSGVSHGLIESLRQSRPGQTLELVHRLDRETSGCLILSKRGSTLRELHRLIRAGALEKRYVALLTGDLPRERTVVDAPLKKNTLASGERMVRVDPVAGKPARTIFHRLRRLRLAGRILTFAEVELLTGRTHQIRVHAAHLDMPLAGDPKYGDPDIDRLLKPRGLTRLFLHAARLRFRADDMPRPFSVEAPLPADLERVLTALESAA